MSPVNDVLLVLLGTMPSLIWLSIFLKEDRHPEPKALIAKTFLMGIIISPLAVFLQAAFSDSSAWNPGINFIASGTLFYLWAAFVEEFLKFTAVRIIALNDPAFDEPVDAMIYMMAAGLGFAAIENILVLFRTAPSSGIQAALAVWTLRSVGATLLHALSTGLMGYFLALSWFFRQHRKKFIVLGLTVATLFHFSFNVFLAAAEDQIRGLVFATLLLGIMAFLVLILFAKMKQRTSGSIRLAPAVEKNISET